MINVKKFLYMGSTIDQALRALSSIEKIEELPENRLLYKDSGTWQIRDDSDEVLYSQEPYETFEEFIERCWIDDNIWRNL
jgi:hypothetical protein